MSSETHALDNAACQRLPAERTDEEPLNAAIHGVGFALSLCGAAAVVAAHAHVGRSALLASCVYVATLAATYAVSTLSHVVRLPRSKQRWRAWDQGVIYLLIVGTYTPMMWRFVPADIMLPVLALLWLAAAAGFISKTAFHHRVGETFSSLSYVALGWLPSLALARFVPWECLQWIVLGGVLYTIGVVFLALDRRVRYFHALWHVFVILASACHFWAIYAFVL